MAEPAVTLLVPTGKNKKIAILTLNYYINQKLNPNSNVTLILTQTHNLTQKAKP